MESKWISCKEEMPKKFHDVLIFVSYNKDTRIAFADEHCWDDGNEGYDFDEVSHWMELPKNPENE